MGDTVEGGVIEQLLLRITDNRREDVVAVKELTVDGDDILSDATVLEHKSEKREQGDGSERKDDTNA